MVESFDTIIIGLGAMGSSTAYHLAKAGQRVLGLDRFTPPHPFGSSHGQTRIIREAYFEHPSYVPLVQRAYALWAELEERSGRPLFVKTGGLMIGPPDGVVFAGAKRSAEQHGLAHEVLTAEEVRRRFPALQPTEDMMAIAEPRAGILFPEACIAAHLELARKQGAKLALEEPVVRWKASKEDVRVFTAHSEFGASRLVLTAGAWLNSLVPELNLPLRVERQVLFWFKPIANSAAFGVDRCPIHIWQFDRDHFFYGFPDLGNGVKVARHREGETSAPDSVRREVSRNEVQEMSGLLQRFIPDAAGPLLESTVCLYTNTPDTHFLIDAHPEFSQVLIVSPCSGHGFKFSSAIGELVADLIRKGETRYDLRLFKNRFGTAHPTPRELLDPSNG